MRVLHFLSAVLCAFLVPLALLAVRGMENPYGALAKEGEKIGQEYYLYSCSSQAEICPSVSILETGMITGEKAVFAFKTEKEAYRCAMKLLDEQGAKVIFRENVSGAYSIYAYTKKRASGVCLLGETVNLHIVLSGKIVQVGMPLIFGGY